MILVIIQSCKENVDELKIQYNIDLIRIKVGIYNESRHNTVNSRFIDINRE